MRQDERGEALAMRKGSFYRREANAEDYDQDRFGGTFGHLLQSSEVDLYLSLVGGPHEAVLDLGAGTGKLSLPLAERCRHVVSTDGSPEMIRITARKAREEGAGLNAVVCDAHDLCYGDRSFDCVVSSRLLMHLRDWRKAVSELCRVSRGMVVLDFPPLLSSSGPGALLRALRTPFMKRQTYRVFWARSVTRELERNGFRVVAVERQWLLPIALHRMLNSPRLSLRMEKLFRRLGLIRALGAPVTVKAVRETANEEDR